jgi:hypothetical protein
MTTRKTSSKLANGASAGNTLIADIRLLVADARSHVAATANATLTLLYWRIGRRIRADVLAGDRSPYGEQIVVTLARQLEAEYGNSFGEKNLRRMIQFAQVFPDEKIVVSLIRELSWTHFLALLPLKETLQREFYAEMCRAQRWSVRTLREKIGGMLYERTALSRKPAELARLELAALRDEDRVSTDLVLRDPYLLEFLGLKDTYQEKDLEAAVLRGWSSSSWSWVADSHSWPDRGASRSTTRTSTSTCCSTSATLGGWWWWN